MVSAGRIACVAFPFVITLVAFLCLLVATLGGKHVPSAYMFKVDLTDMSMDQDGIKGFLEDLIDRLKKKVHLNVDNLEDRLDNITTKAPDVNLPDVNLPSVKLAIRADDFPNITAKLLGLDNVYYVNLWGSCHGKTAGDTKCDDPKWDWASDDLNVSHVEEKAAKDGVQINLPHEVQDALKVFAKTIKGVEYIYAVALGLLGLELFFGFFTGWSRIWSCLAYFVAGLATTAALASAIAATVVIGITVEVLKGAGKLYGIKASANNTFLALIWLAVALSLIAGLFWCFSTCCCSPESGGRRGGRGKKRHASEKQYASSYEPLASGAGGHAPAGKFESSGPTAYQTGGGYEPFSHRV